mgnify:CR=1 FL=1
MKVTIRQLKQIIKEEVNEAFEIPGADALRTLADGLDKAFDAIRELNKKIKNLESRLS